jgi:hypothetical protein
MRHRPWIMLSLALCLAVLVAGCAKKETAQTTSADTTAFATNPTEQGQGNLTPQGQVPPPTTPPPSQAPPAPAPQPKPHKTAPAPRAEAPAAPAPSPGVTVPSGTPLTVTLNNAISSQTAQVGDTWSGVVAENVNVGEKTVIPAGSTVTGTVTNVTPAKKGDRAMLDLAVDGMTVEGQDYRVHATTEAVVAGSTRARNLGAMAGGAAAGALIGRAVGGSGKGALIGGLIGGAAAGGAVAASKGYQVVLKEGTKMTFNTSAAVAIKR